MIDYSGLFAAARKAALSFDRQDKINDILRYTAGLLEQAVPRLLEANVRDLQRMSPEDYKYDRLQLNASRIAALADDMRHVAELPSPLGRVLSDMVRPNGLRIQRVAVPMGVVGVIYEARPNVTTDVFALCLKSGNACILKGGSDAHYSNEALAQVIHEALSHFGVNAAMATLLPSEREATAALLNARGMVDVIIPRGSQGLIDYVCENSRIPVIETGAGIVHTYWDASGDAAMASAIVMNAKTRRVSVCNALDCLIVHSDNLPQLAVALAPLSTKQVRIYADPRAYAALKGCYPDSLLEEADESSYGTEFLDYKMAIRTVDSLDEAMQHIEHYGSRHSEAIISEDTARTERFLRQVDAATVYVNAPTAFTDGAQFGLGAEIGISTQKLHARGPMALEELTTYKWIVRGQGQIRS